MVERSATPLRGGMAILARRGEGGGGMIRRLGFVECVHVAPRAFLAESGELVVDVALLAIDRRVFAGKSELGGRRMVELGAHPLRRGVAGCAIFGEAGGEMVRLCSLLEFSAVAADALHRRSGKLAARMTLLAGQGGMFSGERKASAGVVAEGHSAPCCRRVAHGAFRGKCAAHVIRIRSGLEPIQMARNALLAGAGKFVV